MGWDRFKEVYLPLLVYLTAINVMVVASVSLLHEMGHILIGKIFGCSNINVVLFRSGIKSMYSRMSCGRVPSPLVMFLSSFVFTMPLSALFFLLSKFKEKFMGYIVLGVAIVVSATDLNLFLQAVALEVFVVIIGSLIALYGEYMLMEEIVGSD